MYSDSKSLLKLNPTNATDIIAITIVWANSDNLNCAAFISGGSKRMYLNNVIHKNIMGGYPIMAEKYQVETVLEFLLQI